MARSFALGCLLLFGLAAVASARPGWMESSGNVNTMKVISGSVPWVPHGSRSAARNLLRSMCWGALALRLVSATVVSGIAQKVPCTCRALSAVSALVDQRHATATLAVSYGAR